eukprot:154841-Amphidinium_carterae.1
MSLLTGLVKDRGQPTYQPMMGRVDIREWEPRAKASMWLFFTQTASRKEGGWQGVMPSHSSYDHRQLESAARCSLGPGPAKGRPEHGHLLLMP